MSLVDQSYYDWLVSQITFPIQIKRTYNNLFLRMHQTEFVWTISGDDNRVQDGLDLRLEFRDNFPKDYARVLFNEYVSVFEILIVVSRMTAFVANGQASDWAWQLLENLELNYYPDPWNKHKRRRVDSILETLLWRTYDRNGKGGFFPLINPKEDQTKVEIWYQLNAYVQEIIES